MVAAIWSNIFDYALLYQMKKINYNLTNQLSHQQFPPKHHHRYHHYQYKNKLHRQQSQHRNHRRRQRHHHHEQQQQQQPSQQYHNDVEMKHFQSYITKFTIIESLNVPISKDCPSNINMIKKECKLSCSFSSSSSSSSASSSASPSSLTSSSSSLLLLSSQNV
ncbi:unnamed protein product, partial [Schistosoma curassoni]|uniref:Transmembrane protein n=1 Tax=Schistosoma curassoni TaxID=6186 RepID=A0A183JVL0_9TREM